MVTTIANPTISALFDKMQAQKALMLLSTVGEAVTQIAMLVPGQGYLGMLVWNTLHSLAGGHHSPTFDASTMMVCPALMMSLPKGILVTSFLAMNMNLLQAYMMKMSMKLVWLATQMGALSRGAGVPLISIV